MARRPQAREGAPTRLRIRAATSSANAPDWTALFEAVAVEIRHAFGEIAASIDHVGSTAVSGLEGKASLDVLVGLAGLPFPSSVREEMRLLGYRRLRVRRSGRLYFWRPGPPPVFIHVFQWTDPHWVDLLSFRDQLRADPQLRERYSALKRELKPESRSGYSTGKRRFVASALSAPKRRT